jgi:hypothetical protein
MGAEDEGDAPAGEQYKIPNRKDGPSEKDQEKNTLPVDEL